MNISEQLSVCQLRFKADPFMRVTDTTRLTEGADRCPAYVRNEKCFCFYAQSAAHVSRLHNLLQNWLHSWLHSWLHVAAQLAAQLALPLPNPRKGLAAPGRFLSLGQTKSTEKGRRAGVATDSAEARDERAKRGPPATPKILAEIIGLHLAVRGRAQQVFCTAPKKIFTRKARHAWLLASKN
jgi:hypothetical protein